MIVVDSSAFIEYYRPSGSPGVRTAVVEAIDADLVAVNGIIQVEICAFARETDQRKLQSDFKVFHWLSLDSDSFDLATQLGVTLRREGITVPATDLIIAASALQARATLYHADTHYDQISRHSNLVAKNLLGSSRTR